MRHRTHLAFLGLGHFFDHYALLILPTAVLAIHREWGLSYGEALALGILGQVALAAATLPAGWLGDRFGGRRLMTVFFVGLGAALVGTACVSGPLGLTIGLAAVGLFAAIYHPVATALLVEATGGSGRALAANGVYGNLGVAAAAVGTATLIGWLDWRAAFAVPGVVLLALGTAYGIGFARTRPGEPPRPAAVPAAEPASDVDARLLVLLIAAIALSGGLVFAGITVTLPRLLEVRLGEGIDLPTVGLIVSILFAVAAFAQLPTGRFLDRAGAGRVLPVLAAGQAVALVAVFLVSGPWVVPIAGFLVVLVFAEIPVTAWLVARAVPGAWHGRAYAVQFLLSLGVGVVALPAIALLDDHGGGPGAVFLALCPAAVVIFLCGLALPAHRPPGRPVPDMATDGISGGAAPSRLNLR